MVRFLSATRWHKLMNRSLLRGFTLVETMMVVTIIGILAGLTVVTLAGLRNKDALSRATQQIYDDLLLMRGRAVATSKTHRLRFLSDTSWVMEDYDTSWVATGGTRNMPANTNLMSGSLTNAGSNLEATSRGIFQFQGGATGSPYVSLESRGVSQTKSIYVYTGGAIEIRTQ